jgi:ribonucleoside-diphosphate reductase alpha chain
MTARRRLPHRRGAVALDIEHAGHRYRMHVGYFPDGTVGEVFVDATKQNSTLDALAADAAVLLSLLLQHGALPAEIGHALRRSPNGASASLIGAVVDELHTMERQQDRSAS